jgi:hypothetical protein
MTITDYEEFYGTTSDGEVDWASMGDRGYCDDAADYDDYDAAGENQHHGDADRYGDDDDLPDCAGTLHLIQQARKRQRLDNNGRSADTSAINTTCTAASAKRTSSIDISDQQGRILALLGTHESKFRARARMTATALNLC